MAGTRQSHLQIIIQQDNNTVLKYIDNFEMRLYLKYDTKQILVCFTKKICFFGIY